MPPESLVDNMRGAALLARKSTREYFGSREASLIPNDTPVRLKLRRSTTTETSTKCEPKPVKVHTCNVIIDKPVLDDGVYEDNKQMKRSVS